jgi:Fe2+ transport system protein FeoA
MTLHDLPLNQTGIVTALHCTGAERRRMLDLGILPGTQVEVEMGNPLGDPQAYRVRSTVVALRRKQAQLVEIQVVEAPHPHPQGA